MRLRSTLLALVLVTAACGSDDSVTSGTTSTIAPTTTIDPSSPHAAVATDLATARERWASDGPGNYGLEWSPNCFCPEVRYLDTIINGELISHEIDGDEFGESTGRTMEDLFDEIDDALERQPFRIEATFGADGRVVSYWVDANEMMADEEYGVTVHAVNDIAIEPPGEPVPTAAELTVDHPCGHGFAKGDEAQTLALVIFYSGESPDDTILDEPVDLSTSGDWTARITIGEDLFANWCDDAVEEDDPTPRIDREYTLTAGTLTGSTDGATATAQLVGAVAKPVGGGEIIELAAVALRNTGWAVYAG